VASVIGKTGRANTATDPAPLDMFETVVNLKPESEWRDGMTYDRLVAELDEATRMPGVTNLWTMPIKNRIDMLATGMRTPVGVKVFGPDLDELQRIGTQIERCCATCPARAAHRRARRERLLPRRRGGPRRGGPLRPERHGRAAGHDGRRGRHGRHTDDRGPRAVRRAGALPARLPSERERRRETRVPVMGGTVQIPLAQLATLRMTQGPMVVKTEDAFPVSAVYVDVEDRDIGSYVADARRVLDDNLTLPTGYTVEWSGQFEAMERVREKMQLVVPVTLALIFLLLFLHFRNATETLIVMATLPFALVGGIWLLWLLGYSTSVAVWVGFIALAGVAAETGVVMLVYLDGAFHRRALERAGSLDDHDAHAGHSRRGLPVEVLALARADRPVVVWSEHIEMLLGYTPRRSPARLDPPVARHGRLRLRRLGLPAGRLARAAAAAARHDDAHLAGHHRRVRLLVGRRARPDRGAGAVVGARHAGHDHAARPLDRDALDRPGAGRARGAREAAPGHGHRDSTTGIESVVAVGDLRSGDVVLVRPGESVPADGVVRKGESELDEAMITGESRPVRRARATRSSPGRSTARARCGSR
jgi:hypothetical protein